MSEIELNPMFLRMRKGLGDVVFFERDGRLYTRVKGRKNSQPSAAQLEVQAAFARLTSDWSSAGTLMNNSWYRYGEKKKLNGYNLFIKQNFKNERERRLIELFRPLGEIMSPSISAAPGAAGEIVCTFTIPATEAGRFIHFFAKKTGDNEATMKRFSPGSGAASPYTISGLDAGADYFVYAVLTDKDYREATEVSSSVGVPAKAGA